jgi:HK97 family phage portal protein
METPEQREQRIADLEQRRSQRGIETRPERAAGTIWPTPDDVGLELTVGPGRGDLNFSSTYYPSFPSALLLIGGKVASFARIFMTQPWVAAAVMRMLTWSVRVPLKVYRKTGDENSRVRVSPDEHPLAAAVLTPWDRGDMAGLVQAFLGPLLVHGNSVVEVQSGRTDKIRFLAHDWRFTRPMMPFRDSIDGFTFDIDQPKYMRDVSVDDVLHVAWWSPIGPIGCSPLQQLGITLRIEDAAQRWQQSIFMNGARPPSAITASDEFLGLDRVERQQIMGQLRQDITQIYANPENAGRPALLPPGLDWKEVGHTAVEAELISQRKITREEIAAVYQIPPPMLGQLDKATFSNINTQYSMVYTDCLGPLLVLVEQAINAQVVRDRLQEDDIYCEFDFAGVLRGDRLAEINSLREAIGTALMTPNEGRDVLNYPQSPNPAMSEFFIPANNLQPIGTPPSLRLPGGYLPQQDPGQPGPSGPPGRPPPPPGARRTLHVRSRDGDYEKELV